MVRRMGDLLTERSDTQLVGRSSELAALAMTLQETGAAVTHVHGVGGIGKSALLAEFSTMARRRGASVVSLDCGAIEPTPRGFIQELSAAVGINPAATLDVASVADRLGSLGERVVLILDTYELLRLLDTWLRQDFVPELPENVRVVLAGREPPVPSWLSSPAWAQLFQSIPLESLPEVEALRLLQRHGVTGDDAASINRFARGHPLALRLSIAAIGDQPRMLPEDAAIPHVVAELIRLYLRDVNDPATRRALEAVSIVRRATLPLLRAMLPDCAPHDTFDRLRDLPFVDLRRDGLYLHDTVRQALATHLRAADPNQFQAFRLAAWECLKEEVRRSSRNDLWRYTADMLYLIENPVVREAFFPSESYSLAFEPSRPADDDAVRHIITTTELPEAAGHLTRLWERAPHTFRIARDRDGTAVGFYCLFQPQDVAPDVLKMDPILSAWLDHLTTSPTHGQQTLFARRWLDRERGELPSPVQAAAWLDMKRAYMELRPRLGRVYMTVMDLETYGGTAQRLMFNLLPDTEVILDGRPHYTAVNDFGPQSVDGWLARMVGAELGVDTPPDLLDVLSRELVLNGARVPLTHLEFETLRYLHDREGTAISRDELLDNVWGDTYAGGSNVVDVVVLSLRRKLGTHATCLQTVRGTGYRYRRE